MSEKREEKKRWKLKKKMFCFSLQEVIFNSLTILLRWRNINIYSNTQNQSPSFLRANNSLSFSFSTSN